MPGQTEMIRIEGLKKVYGTGVTVDTMKAANELRFFANKYYEKLIASYVYTEDECEEHYFKNSDSFLHFDYIKNTNDLVVPGNVN